MINYKKSLLSLATVMALSTTAATAGYIPLTGAGAGLDNQWVLFGVTGLLSSGTGGGTTAGTFSISDDTKYTIIDSTKDEKFTRGLEVSSGNFLGKAKTYTVSYVQVRINTDDFKSKVTEPVHTMYVTMASGSGPAFAVTYDAALEGRTMEYSVSTDGSNAHTITLDSAKTYSNPGFGELIQTAAGTGGSSLSGLTDIVDYDFTNNPPSSSSYSKLTYQSAAEADEYLRVYSYDTANTKWDLFDTRNSDDVNDFSELKKGKAYWGKMNEVGDKQAGLVLGSSSISSLEYQAAGLTDGWNLVSFSAENSTIRKSSTGLILALKDNANAGKLKIWDSSGNQFVIVNSINGDDGAAIIASCLSINQSIKQAKLEGKMPATFDLKAFPIDLHNIVLISNKRFMIDEQIADVIEGVTTLTGLFPYTVDPADIGNTDDSNPITELDFNVPTSAALSKYGEYTMIIEPLVGAGTASALEAKIHLQNASSDATDATAQDITTAADANAVATILSATIGGATFVSTGIDTDYDQTTEKVLIASTKPFYVRDYTFTRVFDYTDVNADSNIRITGAGLDLETAVNGVQTADAFATAINDAANNVKADDVGSKIIIFTSQDNASKFDVTENIETSPYTDQLKDGTTSDPMAKGAVQGVYSLDNYATATVNSTVFADETGVPDDALDTVKITLRNSYSVDSTEKTYTVGPDVGKAAWTIKLKSYIEAELSTAKLTGTVTVDGGDDADHIDVTVVSSDVIGLKLEWTSGGGGGNDESADDQLFTDNTVTSGILATVSADLSSDLQFNAVYAPNYVSDGPLYSMKEVGFNMKAMVTGATDLDAGTINWESIDLTRKPSEWLSSQDYALFQTDAEAGYWVYLEANADANPLSITATTFSPVYTTHFNVNGTTYNNVAGQIAVEVAGLPQVGDANYDNSAIVKAIVNGSTIELTKKSTNNVYSGDVSSYEHPILADSDYSININVADGLGSNLMNQVSGKTVDMTKPATPVVSVGDGSAVSFTSTSTDVAGYYIFNGQIPDYQTSSATNKLAELTAAEAGAYALCSATGMDQLTAFDTAAYTLNVIAVDGTGKLGGGNASDVVTQDYIPMLKNAVKLSDTNNGESDATILGTEYGADCAETGPQTENYGMAITSESDLQEVKIAYTKEDSGSDTAVQVTAFFKGETVIAKVTYSDVYIDSIVYIEVEGTVYSYKLLSEDDLETHGSGTTDTDPILLKTDATVQKRPAQQL